VARACPGEGLRRIDRMTPLPRLIAGLALWGAAALAWAQAPSVAPPAVAASAAGADVGAKLTVIEDDGVRIEETRLQGQAKRIVVQSKVGDARPYEIIVGPGGRDPSKDRGAVGQSAWSLFDF